MYNPQVLDLKSEVKNASLSSIPDNFLCHTSSFDGLVTEKPVEDGEKNDLLVLVLYIHFGISLGLASSPNWSLEI